MREIKFRAWHGKNKRMYTICEISFMKNSSDEFIERGCEGYWGDNHRDRFSLNDLKLMQFTGLKDKNGKEIYEGDIVKTHETSNKRLSGLGGNIFKIVFEEGSFEMYRKGNHEGLERCCSYEGFIEVIGNIYENPELLMSKNEIKSVEGSQ